MYCTLDNMKENELVRPLNIIIETISFLEAIYQWLFINFNSSSFTPWVGIREMTQPIYHYGK